MPWNGGAGVPTTGNKLVIIAADNNGQLHFRIFDADGKRVLDTDETKIAVPAEAITALKQQLAGLWPPHVLTADEKAGVVVAVASIAGLSKAPPAPGGGTAVNPFPDPNNPQPKNPTANTPAKPTALGAFLAANSPASDPHGWGVLDRMGLAVGFRVRLRQTGAYVVGQELAELVRWLVASLKATPISVDLPRARRSSQEPRSR